MIRGIGADLGIPAAARALSNTAGEDAVVSWRKTAREIGEIRTAVWVPN